MGSTYIFALAIQIAKRVKLALAPLLLGSLYTMLVECIGNINDVVTRADSSFLQMYAWERSWVIALKPMKFPSDHRGCDTGIRLKEKSQRAQLNLRDEVANCKTTC